MGDLQTAALVGTGRLDRLAVPAALRLAGLLRRAARRRRSNGHWLLAPAGGGTCTRRATGATRWCWRRLGDPGRHRPGHRLHAAARQAPDVVRIVEGVSRHGRRCTAMLRLRFDYGQVVPWVRRVDGHRSSRSPGPDAVWLRTPAAARTGQDFATRSEFTVSAGRAGAVRADLAPARTAPRPSRSTRTRRWTSTEACWAEWSARCTLRRAP